MDWLKICPCIGGGAWVWVPATKTMQRTADLVAPFCHKFLGGASAPGAIDCRWRVLYRRWPKLRERGLAKIHAMALEDNFATLAVFAVLKRDAIAGLQLALALKAGLIEIDPLTFYRVTPFFTEELVAAVFIKD